MTKYAPYVPIIKSRFLLQSQDIGKIYCMHMALKLTTRRFHLDTNILFYEKQPAKVDTTTSTITLLYLQHFSTVI